MSEPLVELDVRLLHDQEITIVMRGPDVLRFGDGRTGEDARIPHPVDVFVTAANLGMFPERHRHSVASTASLLAREIVRDKSIEYCTIEVRHVAPAAFRVLTNMLRARDLDEVCIRTTAVTDRSQPPASKLDLRSLNYPSVVTVSFQVDYITPDRTARDRVVDITLGREPTDRELDIAYAGIESWTMLLMLAGYAADGQQPAQSGAIPDRAFLLMPDTIEQSFPDVFLCDESCFAALVNWIERLHRSTCPVDRVTIR
jgi:hypothetical protein